MSELSWFRQVSSAGTLRATTCPLWIAAEPSRRMNWQSKQGLAAGPRRERMSIGTIILIILVIALLGGFSGIGGGPFYGTGYYGGGGLGLIIVILLILLLLGRI